MLLIDPITSDNGFDRLLPEWRALWRRVPDATPFQSPEWLHAWWHCFGNAAPRIVTIRYDGVLAGVLPLYLREEPECRKLLPIGVSLSDYIDALLDPDHRDGIDTLFEAIAASNEWDECHLPDVPPFGAILHARCPAGLVETLSDGNNCPFIALPSTAQSVANIIPRKKRRNVSNARSRADAIGPVSFRRADSGTVAADINALFRLHEKRWHLLGGEGVCATAPVKNFHLAAAGRLQNAGMLRLYVMEVGRVLIAANYGFVANGIAYAYLSGFDPDYAQLSPGTQLLGHAIEQSFADGAREFHFLRGDEAHKRMWGARDRHNAVRILKRAR